ncbi:hypothetical protein CANARDRAFT_204937, partial [[Candida] arabinofermentans NRRL YB-2248]
MSTRSLKFSGLRPDIELREFLDVIEFGPIEKCVFELAKEDTYSSATENIILSFVETKTAEYCYTQLVNITEELSHVLESPQLEITPYDSQPLQSVVQKSIQDDGATRSVCLSNIPPAVPQKLIYEELEKFGPIETLKYVVNKGAAFLHFTAISSAIKCVEQLPLSDSIFSSCKVFYSRDRSTYAQTVQLTPAAQYSSQFATDHQFVDPYNNLIYSNSVGEMTVTHPSATSLTIIDSIQQSNIGNRTVYLGNLHPETTAEEICNSIRGGLLELIKLIPEKHICFVTFIEHLTAAQFFASGTMDKVVIHGRKVKIGWGKNSGPLNKIVAQAVEKGASRNLYIGLNTHITKVPDVDILRRDFSVFGEIEQINFFKDGQCAFVNFLSISSSISAVNEFNGENAETVHISFQNRYKKFKISYGKDRCGNPPKS